MIRQCAIIMGCLAAGEFIVWLTGIQLPSSIIGMLLLTSLLKAGWVKLEWVKGIADLLMQNLGFFFVPPGVALMLYFDMIKNDWVAITAATVISTAIVMWATGWSYRLTRKSQRRLTAGRRSRYGV